MPRIMIIKNMVVPMMIPVIAAPDNVSGISSEIIENEKSKS